MINAAILRLLYLILFVVAMSSLFIAQYYKDDANIWSENARTERQSEDDLFKKCKREESLDCERKNSGSDLYKEVAKESRNVAFW